MSFFNGYQNQEDKLIQEAYNNIYEAFYQFASICEETGNEELLENLKFNDKAFNDFFGPTLRDADRALKQGQNQSPYQRRPEPTPQRRSSYPSSKGPNFDSNKVFDNFFGPGLRRK